MNSAVVRALQARLHLPQASQLAAQQSPATSANDRISGALCSPFLSGGAARKIWSSSGGTELEPCLPSWERAAGGRRGGGVKVECMAKERRVKMVSQQIKREISEMLLYDKVVQAAVLPETTLGADMYLTAVATISEVEMSKDLSVAKVYISIYGDDRSQEKALEALKSRAGYVRKCLAQRMNLKNTPEVRFIKDESLERGSRVIGILDKLKKERQQKEGKGLVDEEGEDLDSDQQDNIEDDVEEVEEVEDVEDVEEDKSIRSFSTSKDDEEESDWEEGENITFIR